MLSTRRCLQRLVTFQNSRFSNLNFPLKSQLFFQISTFFSLGEAKIICSDANALISCMRPNTQSRDIFYPPLWGGGETGFRELFPPIIRDRGGEIEVISPHYLGPWGEIKKFPLHFLARWGGSARRRRKIWRIGALKCSISLRKML